MLRTLRPSVQTLDTRTARTQTVERIRGRKLQAIRADHFERSPLCVKCLEVGITRVWTQLDHAVALVNGGRDVDSNRQGLCAECHDIKTVEDMAQARGAA